MGNNVTSQFYGDSIFWVPVEKIKPNPYQPRREFESYALQALADSIRMYGVLQPLVVTRSEVEKEDGLSVEYELVSGERRLRASKLAGVREVPVIIRNDTEDGKLKLELAIIENLQREDLNPVERARAFERLSKEFGFKNTEIAAKIGKSREYVANTIRILNLSQDILEALSGGKISEGHTRPLLMLNDKKEEQQVLFKEIIYRKLNVREAELYARKIAFEKSRKKDESINPEIQALEVKLASSLGTRVHIETGKQGGKIQIDFFTMDDLNSLISILGNGGNKKPNDMVNKFIAMKESGEDKNMLINENTMQTGALGNTQISKESNDVSKSPKEDDDSIYVVNNFTI